MTYRDEFPDYPAADMPRVPAAWRDTSWHNDACPSFTHETADLILWVDYKDPAARELHGARFALLHGIDPDPQTTLYEGDDWRACMTAALAHYFAAVVRAWLVPADIETVRARNAAHDARDRSYICATHDFCDANMAMDEAWRVVLGADGPDMDNDSDARAWNAAWEIARRNGFR